MKKDDDCSRERMRSGLYGEFEVELVETVQDLLSQHCHDEIRGDDAETTVYDTLSLSANADAARLLMRHGFADHVSRVGEPIQGEPVGRRFFFTMNRRWL